MYSFIKKIPEIAYKAIILIVALSIVTSSSPLPREVFAISLPTVVSKSKIVPASALVVEMGEDSLETGWWESQEKALETEVSRKGEISKFDSTNSARLVFSTISTSTISNSPSDILPPGPLLQQEGEDFATSTPEVIQDVTATTTEEVVSVEDPTLPTPFAPSEENTETNSETPTSEIEEVVPEVVPVEDLVVPTPSDSPEGGEEEPTALIWPKIFGALTAHAEEIITPIATSTSSSSTSSSTLNSLIQSPKLELADFKFEDAPRATTTLSKVNLNLSLAAPAVSGAKLSIEYSEDGTSWFKTGEESFDSVSDNFSRSGYLSFEIPKSILDNLPFLKVRLSYSYPEEQLMPGEALLIDGVWLEASYNIPGFSWLDNSTEISTEILYTNSGFSRLEISSKYSRMSLPGTLDTSFLIGETNNLTKQLRLAPLGVNASTTAERAGNTIIYREALENTDLRYEVRENVLKEYIELTTSDHPSEFAYLANLEEFDVVKVSDLQIDLYRKGKGGQDLYKRYSISAPVMTDAEGQSSNAIKLEVEGNLLVVTPDADWLEKAAYPVVVDPTIEISVLNIHSHPVEGDIWSIDFITVGEAPLSVTPADQDTRNDMSFVSLSCLSADEAGDGEALEPETASDGTVTYENWSCDGVGRIEHRVLKTGNHHFVFDFGGETADAYNAALVWKGTTNNLWSVGTNWSTGAKPTSADSVTFDNTCTNCDVTIDENTTVTSFTIGATYTGTITQSDDLTLKMTGAFSQSAGYFKGGTGTTTFGSSITVSSGTFTPATSTVLNSGSVTLNVNVSQEFYHLHSTSTGTRTISSGDTLVVKGDLYLVDGAFNTGIIDARGNIYQASTFDGGTATLDFGNDSVAQTITMEGGIAPIIRLNSAADANDSITFNATSTLYGLSVTADFSGTIPISNPSNYGITISAGGYSQAAGTFQGGPWTLTSSNGNFTISGGTFNAPTTTTFSVGNNTIDVNSTQTFENVVFNNPGTNKVIASGDTLVVTGDLTLTDGTVNTGTIDTRGNITVASTFDGGTATLDFGNDSVAQTMMLEGGKVPNIRLDNAADANDSIVFNAASQIQGMIITSDFSGTVPISNPSNHDITMLTNGGSGWTQAAGVTNLGGANLTIDHGFTLSGGTFNGGTGTTTIQWGNFTVSGTGIFNAPTTTVFAGGWPTIDINNTQEFYNLQFNNDNGGRGSTITSGDTVVIGGTLTLINGYVNGPGTTAAQGNVVVASTWDGGTSPLTFSGSNSQTFDLTGATGLYNADITVNKSGGEVALLSALVMDAASQDLKITSGTFNLNGQALQVNGTSGTLQASSTGILKLNGDETLTLNVGNPLLATSSAVEYAGSGSYTIKDWNYGGLTISGSGTFTTPNATEDLPGSFTQTAGTFTAPSGNFNIAKDFSHTGGSFIHNSGTVVLTGGNQTITGDTTFNNFTKSTSTTDTLIFASSSTQTIEGALTLSGASSNLLSLRSNDTGKQWNIDPQGTRVVSYLDVQDSNNTNDILIDATDGASVNSGDNTNWDFGETFSQENFRWYENLDNATPTTPSEDENTALTVISILNPLRLRMSVLIGSTDLIALSRSFTLQVSNLLTGGWQNVGATTTVSFYNNPSVSSGTTLSSTLLTNSTVTATYEETATSSPNPILAAIGSYLEFDFSLDISSIVSGVTYFFRLILGDGTELDTYTNYASVTYDANISPDVPSSLGPSSLVDGSWTTDNTPTLTFTLSDSDIADTAKYHILIDDTSDFSSPTVDYTSSLQAQGATSYTPSALDDGSYYWRVSASDDGGAASATTTANSGSIAFKVDATDPTAGTLSDTSVDTTSVTISISGASDATSGLAAAPYVFTNSTTGATSGATALTSWTFSSLSSNTSYSFYATVSDLAGNSTTTSSVSTTTTALPASQDVDTGGNTSGSSSGNNGGSSSTGSESSSSGPSLLVSLLLSSDGKNYAGDVSGVAGVTSFRSRGIVVGAATNTRITYEFDFDGDDVYEKRYTSKNATYTISYRHIFPEPGFYVIKMKVTDSVGNIAISAATANISGQFVESSLSASLDRKAWWPELENIKPNTRVSLRASTNTNLSGSAVYRFDCQNDGVFERFSTSSSVTVTASNLCRYPSPGLYTAFVSVTKKGITSTDTVTIAVGMNIPIEIEEPPTVEIPTTTPATSTDESDTGTSTITIITDTVTDTVNNIVDQISNAIGDIINDGHKIVDVLVNTGSKLASKYLPLLPTYLAVATNFAEAVLEYAATTTAKVRSGFESIPDKTVTMGITTGAIAPASMILQYSLASQGLLAGIRSIRDLWAALLGLIQGLLTSLGLRKRRRYWGTVYDSIKKQGIDPAIVDLINIKTGKVVEKSVTDLFGRFGFLDRPGKYVIRASKTHYKFPSEIIVGSTDGVFTNVYHGEILEIKDSDEVLAPNIPMDPLESDWNQEEKARKGVGKLNFSFEFLVAVILKIAFWAGFAFVSFSLLFKPGFANILFFLFYLFLIWLNRYIPDPRLWGRVVSPSQPTENLLLELEYQSLPGIVVSKAVTNNKGKFFLKASPGNYVLSVRKIGDETNTLLKEFKIRIGREMIFNNTVKID